MKLHPIVAIYFICIILFMILIYDHPLLISSILLFLVIFIKSLEKEKRIFQMIKYGLFNVVLLIIINPLVSQGGKTVVFRGPKIPLLGRVRITTEAIAYGGTMGLKLICIFMLFLIYGMLTNSDDNFNYFSRFAHKLTLTFSMTINIIHRLRLETIRVKDVMQMRGVNFHVKKLKNRVRAYYPLFKVVFISALEGSIDRAETLHSRNYGNHRRTNYVLLKYSKGDYVFIAISAVLTILMVVSVYSHVGMYSFYPELKAFTKINLLWISVLDMIFFGIIFYAWRYGEWHCLK